MKIKRLIAVLILITFNSCASMQGTAESEKEPSRFDREVLALDKVQEDPGVAVPEPGPEVPDFLPVKEESSPLKNKTISIAAKYTPLKEVLHIIAAVANLNIVMENGVDPELPISMTVKDIAVDEALEIIFNSVDYFYQIKNNILIVKATGTEIFEIDQPNIIHDYKINIGGDILSGSSSSGGEGESPISGEVTMSAASDTTSFKFWDAMEKSLTTLLSSGTGGAGESEDEVARPKSSFVLNRMAGTIMVTATKNELKRVGNYIANVKMVLNRQVMVEARIVEVQLTDSLKYGIDWTLVGDWLGSGSFVASTNAFDSVVTAGSPNFLIDVTDTDLGFLLQALEQQGAVKTLSNPRVNIMNGQTSMLSVGRNTTFISKVETTTTTDGGTGVTSFSVETNSILSGLIFGLVPYINSDDKITLTITPIITDLVELEAKTVGASDNSVEIKLPTVDLREMSTTVKVLDGQMVIIGGLIDKKETLRENRVPVLGRIPLIGNAFKSVDKSYENTELVIMLIPRIIR